MLRRGNEEMDRKIQQSLRHYLELFASRNFDEYDVYGFLILVRDNVSGWLHDFSDLVAHRKREKGKIYSVIEKTLLNLGQDGEIILEQDGKKVKWYKGIQNNALQNEIKNFAGRYGYNLTKDILNEIVLCIFSIAHLSEYYFDNLGFSRMRLTIASDNTLMLNTEINYNGDWKGTVGFAKLEYNPIISKDEWWLNEPIEILREDGEIVVIYKGKRIS